MSTDTETTFEPWLRTPDQLRELLAIPYSKEQVDAITAPLGQAQSIIAGAGSGKTAVMAARVVWLVGNFGVAPEKILGLTFTTKAAAELASRVRSSLDRAGVILDEGEPTVSTYHSFANDLLREHGVRLGIEPDRQLLTDARRATLAIATVRKYPGPLEHLSTHLSTTAKCVLDLDGQLAEHLVSPEELRAEDAALLAEMQSAAKPQQFKSQIETILKRRELSLLVEEYRAAKTVANVMDFSDQMAWGAMLAADPDVAALVRERFDVVLLDEYQDTSIAQRNLLQSLFRGGSVSAVGDPAQSIYGWRGAASGNLLNFLSDFTAEGAPVPRHNSLSVTRRCAAEIIDMAGVVAKDYYASTEAKGVVEALKAAPNTAAGVVTAALYETIEQEVSATVDWIISEHERGVAWSQIAVLVRNGSENDELVRALRAQKVPVEIVGLSGLLSQPEILDVVSTLAVLDDVTANPDLLRLLLGPRWAIGDRDLVQLARRARQLALVAQTPEATDPDDEDRLAQKLLDATAGIDPIENIALLEAVEDPGPADQWQYGEGARERFADLAAMFTRLRRHVHEPLPDLVRHVIAELDLDVELAVAGLPSDNLLLFLDAVSEFAREEPHASLSALRVHFEAEKDHNKGMEVASPTDADSVKVMTIHKSKGLEFASVVLPFMSKGVFPPGKGRENWLTNGQILPYSLRGDAAQLPQLQEVSKKGLEDFADALKADSLMEETRLAYVAMTRAETRLHVTGHHWGRTQAKPRGPSPFLLAIKEQLDRDGTPTTEWAPAPPDGSTNPHLLDRDLAWPPTVDVPAERRQLAELVKAAPAEHSPEQEFPGELAELRQEVAALIAEARETSSGQIEVERPAVLSATSLMALAADEEAFAEQIARPMPRRPIAAARFGTRFHAWVEGRYGQLGLFDPDETPGRGDVEIDDDADLQHLKDAFERSSWAGREPVAVEQDFVIDLAGQRIVGQIDAVFRNPDGSWQIVDWKTNRQASADPLQLQIYRHAWAQIHGMDPATVTAAFYYVRLDKTVELTELMDLKSLERAIGLA